MGVGLNRMNLNRNQIEMEIIYIYIIKYRKGCYAIEIMIKEWESKIGMELNVNKNQKIKTK